MHPSQSRIKQLIRSNGKKKEQANPKIEEERREMGNKGEKKKRMSTLKFYTLRL